MRQEDVAQLPYRRNVGVMLINHAGHAFVGQRMDSEEPAWQMPQGGIDDGETPRDAALRELPAHGQRGTCLADAQGGIDDGETPRDAALRELLEETGVSPDLVTVEAETEGWISYDLPLHIVPKIWKGRYRGQEQKWFLLRFHGHDDQVRIDADDHQEFSEWRWLPPGELVANIVPFKREVYARVVEAFATHLKV